AAAGGRSAEAPTTICQRPSSCARTATLMTREATDELSCSVRPHRRGPSPLDILTLRSRDEYIATVRALLDAGSWSGPSSVTTIPWPPPPCEETTLRARPARPGHRTARDPREMPRPAVRAASVRRRSGPAPSRGEPDRSPPAARAPAHRPRAPARGHAGTRLL